MTQQNRNSTTPSTRGFTLIEILVVIAIIAVLAGILLAALSGVQKAARKTQTESLLQSFARACDSFAFDHGRYPGLLPESAVDGVAITSTQNAMLELMGGARMVRDDDTSSPVFNEFEAFLQSGGAELPQLFEDQISGLSWRVAFDEKRFGEGPWISGRVYEPYFSPKSRDMQYTSPETPGDLSDPWHLPSLVDAWETSVLYFRSTRKFGPIIADPATSDNINFEQPQYDLPGFDQYIEDALNANMSLLSINSATGQSVEDRLAWLTLMLAHPTFWEITSGNASSEFDLGITWGATRGRYLLISAGPDKVYLESTNKQIHVDQLVTPGSPFSNILGGGPRGGSITPSMMDTFDDVVVHGGA